MKPTEFFENLKALLAGVDPDEDTASVELDGATINFAAGLEAEVEVARSGKFIDMNKNTVEVTPELMKGLASSLDLTKHEPKLKLGHEPIKTDTPDFGSVVGLTYDEARDRLLAKIRPTQALVRRIREGAFNQRSMEFSIGQDGPRFLHLGFLGARKPAISGLAPVALAEDSVNQAVDGVIVLGYPEDETFLLGISAAERDSIAAEDFAGPGRSFPIDSQAHLDAAAHLIGKAADPGAVKAKAIAIAKRKGFTLPESWKEKDPNESAEGIDKPGRKESEEKSMAETATAEKLDRLKKQVIEGARDRVKAFLATNVKRIPNALIRAQVEDGLVSLMAQEAEAETEMVIAFAGPDGAEKKFAPSAFVMALLAALPEQVTAVETKETATEAKAKETETEVNFAEFPGATPESVHLHLSIEKERAEAKEKGQVIDYMTAAQRIEERRRNTKN